MPLNIKNDEAHQLARELAELTGASITDAVTTALREAVMKARASQRESAERLVSDIAEIALHCASLPVLDPRSPDEILGYDEKGLPS